MEPVKSLWDHLNFWKRDPTLAETLTEKIGGGPHGYGDPNDWSLRYDEYYLFPRMVWKKVRYEKCAVHYDSFYKCISEEDYKNESKCQKFVEDLEACRKFYYELKNDEVELECVKEYLILRNEFRKTADPEVLEAMKDMMLAPKSSNKAEKGAEKDTGSTEKNKSGN